jgi:hypothetical protein
MNNNYEMTVKNDPKSGYGVGDITAIEVPATLTEETGG